MRSRLFRSAVVLAGVVILSGAGTFIDKMLDTQTLPTAQLKAEIVSKARDYVYDPYSIRDAEISNVMLVDSRNGLRAVCVKANAKNLMGAYTGRQATSLRILNGQVISALQGAAICFSPR